MAGLLGCLFFFMCQMKWRESETGTATGWWKKGKEAKEWLWWLRSRTRWSKASKRRRQWDPLQQRDVVLNEGINGINVKGKGLMQLWESDKYNRNQGISPINGRGKWKSRFQHSNIATGHRSIYETVLGQCMRPVGVHTKCSSLYNQWTCQDKSASSSFVSSSSAALSSSRLSLARAVLPWYTHALTCANYLIFHACLPVLANMC